MLVRHRLDLSFRPSHIQEPLTWEMAQRFRELMFNIHSVDVGIDEANMRLSLVGEPTEVKQAKAYLRELGATVRTLSSQTYKGKIPNVPKRQPRARQGQRIVERKLWLTFIGSQQREPFLWSTARKFDITYKIMQSATGRSVAILSLLIWGPKEEVEGAVAYLREQGINVEYGEVGVSAPFTPVG